MSDQNPALSERQIIERLVDAQAELQTGLGMFRLGYQPGRDHAEQDQIIEGYLTRSLKMQQRLLALLGNPMAGGPTEDVVPRA